jgi:hypothetical protein
MGLRVKEYIGKDSSEHRAKFIVAVDENDAPQSLPLTDKPENRRILEEFIRNVDCNTCGG